MMASWWDVPLYTSLPWPPDHSCVVAQLLHFHSWGNRQKSSISIQVVNDSGFNSEARNGHRPVMGACLPNAQGLRQSYLLAGVHWEAKVGQWSLYKKFKNHWAACYGGCLLKEQILKISWSPKISRILNLGVCILNQHLVTLNQLVLTLCLQPWLSRGVTREINKLRLPRPHPGPIKSDSLGMGPRQWYVRKSSLGAGRLKSTSLRNATKALLPQPCRMKDY